MFNDDVAIQLVLGKYKAYTLPERIQNGIYEMAKTIGTTLILFTLIFWYFLEPRSKVQDLENHDMIDSIDELYPTIRAFNNNMPVIIAGMFLIPSSIYAFLSLKNSFKKCSSKSSSNNQNVIEPSQSL